MMPKIHGRFMTDQREFSLQRLTATIAFREMRIETAAVTLPLAAQLNAAVRATRFDHENGSGLLPTES
jgi:hypothetical protein